MALSPFFDFYRPSSLYAQHFGTPFTPEDILPYSTFGNYCRPWRTSAEDIGSTICQEKDKFCICLDVQQFRPNEITVKTVGRQIMIEGKHEERQDEHGFISRQFMRKYAVPEGYESEDVTSSLTADGVLMIEAKKKSKNFGSERIVPINKIAAICQKKKDTAQNIKDSSQIMEKKRDENGKTSFEQNGKTKIKEENMMTKMENMQIEMKEDFKKTDSMKDDFKMKGAKEERCSLLNSDGTLKFSSDMSSEAMRAAKTSSIEERVDFSSSSMMSEMTQSKESSFSSTEMSRGIRSGEKATDFISDIINAELKQATENL